MVDSNDYKVSYIGNTENLQTPSILMQEAFLEALDKNKELLSVGTFVSIAEKFEKIVELDKGVTSRVIEHIKESKVAHKMAINVSARTVKMIYNY